MNKNIPENTLSVIKSEGRVVYLTDIHRIPLETKGYPKDSWYGKAQDGGYTLPERDGKTRWFQILDRVFDKILQG